MDKVKLFSQKRDIIPLQFLKDGFNHLRTVHNPVKNHIRTTFENDKGVVVSIDGFGTYITCNPTKYIKGSNAVQITRSEFLDFIMLLENDLEVNTDNWALTGFDFNQNICTQYPASQYLPIFRDLPRYRIVHKDSDGLTYETKSKTTSFSIYDKVKHMCIHKEKVPDHFKDKYIMRLEMGVDKNMKRKLNLSNLNRLRDLADKGNYDRIVDQWYRMYCGINKQSIYKVGNLVKPANISMDDFPLLYYINEQGVENFLYQLECERNNGDYSRTQFANRKKKAMQLWNSFVVSNESSQDLLQEINEAVRRTVEERKGEY